MKNKIKSILQFLLFEALVFLHLPAQLVGQVSPIPAKSSRRHEAGAPFIQNFSPKEYGAHNQNWAIVQDQRGVMYFGNESGVLEYDGGSWRLIPVPNRSVVRSLAVDEAGRIYVGAQREFGYLSADSIGLLHYVSLVEQLNKEDRNFADVWETYATSKGIYFKTVKKIFCWSDKQFKVWTPDNLFHSSFVVRDTFYVRQWGVGLMRIEGESLHLLPGGEQFANERVYVMLAFDPRRILIGTRTKGLFLYDGSSFFPFKTKPVVSQFFQKHKLYHGANLPDGTFALATSLNGGVAIIDRKGRLLQILNQSAGLRYDGVNFIYQTNREMWLALDNGLARVETASPLTIIKDSIEENGIIYSMLRHRGKLYLATGTGIQYFDARQNAFRIIPGTNTQCWQLLSANGQLLAATSDGVFQIQDGQANYVRKSLARDYNAHSLLQSQRDSNLVYVGINGGLGFLRFTNGKWVNKGVVPGIKEKILSIAETADGWLWLGTQSEGVLRAKFPTPVSSLIKNRLNSENQPIIQRFGTEQGLPMGAVVISKIAGKIYFATHEKLLHFQKPTASFIPDSTFSGVSFGGYSEDYLQIEDQQGKVWINWGRESAVAVPQLDDSFRLEKIPFLRFADFDVKSIYPESGYKGANDVTWFGGSDGLIRYDAGIKKNYALEYPVLIRRVIANEDSVIYGGISPPPFLPTTAGKPTLAYSANALRFEYALPFYDGLAENQFQYFLQGFNQSWSAWTHETWKDYTNLREGQYSFRVRAKNIYGNISREAVFAFTILPPWYRASWAYAFYVFCFGLALYGVRRVEMKRVQSKYKRESEQVEYHKLKDLDQMKSQFFANISHEFRTPLTLILGPAEELLTVASEPKAKQKLGLIHRNATRLLQLINQLLDLSKLETGKMQLQTSPGDFVAFLKGLTMSFESLAAGKNIDLRFQVKDAPPTRIAQDSQGLAEAYFDRDKIEKIFTNLLLNAFKFTPDSGSVKVSGTIISDCRWGMSNSGNGQKYEFRNPKCETCINNRSAQGATPAVNCIEIRVEDTGHGIPADRLPHIFDRFYQVDASSTRAHEGTGIGLALVKELVAVHNGSIEVQSREGHGTIFTVCLPLGKEHLQVDEITETNDGANLQGAELKHAAEFIEEPEGSEPLPGEEQNGSVDDTIVLIIEDNADVRAYICDHLKSDYKIIEAKDGAEGIDKAMDTIPDLIISDVMMQKKNGYQVCQALKTDERTSHIPIILLTAKAAEQEKIAGLETGADAYILKPFRSKELAVRVRKLIELRRKLRMRFSKTTIIKPSEIAATSMDQVFLQQVIAAAEEHLDDETFGLDALAAKVNMSASQLHRKLRALINQSPGQFLRSLRLQRAANLLTQKAGTVAEIAYQVGFGSQAHFTKMFHKQFGCTPTEYQKRS